MYWIIISEDSTTKLDINNNKVIKFYVLLNEKTSLSNSKKIYNEDQETQKNDNENTAFQKFWQAVKNQLKANLYIAEE